MMLGFGKRRGEETDEEMNLIRKSRYGIGTKRTLKQAEAFTGINFRDMKMDVNKCGNLLWVPYEESPNYGIGEVLSRGHAGEEVAPYIVTPDISRSVLQAELAEQNLRTSNFNASEGVATADYKLIGGLLLVILAIVLKMLTGKRVKDENHKK